MSYTGLGETVAERMQAILAQPTAVGTDIRSRFDAALQARRDAVDNLIDARRQVYNIPPGIAAQIDSGIDAGRAAYDQALDARRALIDTRAAAGAYRAARWGNAMDRYQSGMHGLGDGGGISLTGMLIIGAGLAWYLGLIKK